MTSDVPSTRGNEPPLVEARGLVVGWAGRALLPPVDLAIRQGELWGLVGRNGNGKSTLLKTLIGVLPPVGGSVSDVMAGPGGTGRGGRRARLAYVAQRSEWEGAVPARVIDMTLGGLDVGLDVLRPWRRRGSKARAMAALAEVQADDLARRRFSTLSEGQKQRVWLARALVSEPEVLILDEPTSALDALAERKVFELVDALIERRNLAVILASHHLGMLVTRASHLIYVDRDAELVLAGPRDEVLSAPSVRRRHLLELARDEAWERGIEPAQSGREPSTGTTGEAEGAS